VGQLGGNQFEQDPGRDQPCQQEAHSRVASLAPEEWQRHQEEWPHGPC
jgi:hypothetical protein